MKRSKEKQQNETMKIQTENTTTAEATISQPAVTQTETTNATEAGVQLFDPERGDRLTTKCEDIRMVLQLFPKGEQKEILYGVCRWAAGESEQVVAAEAKELLSPNAVYMLTRLIDSQKRRARLHHQKIMKQAEREAHRALRRRNRAQQGK